MQNLKLLLPLALFISAFFVACHEDEPFGIGPSADVAFVGRIMDEDGDAVQGALVKAGNENTVSDANGVFRLPSVRLTASHAMVTVSKAGFFEISRPYIIKDEALQTITIQLLTKTLAGTVIASAGGLVNVAGGPILNFPANAVADANGNAYSGAVRVFARYLDPSDPMLGLFLPGDMTAENATDDEVFLATYGMVGVEIEGSNGQKLKIAADKEVELRMPIIASQLAAAPATIPLWHYDLEDGHWHEEGSAQKTGNEYVGKVKHFSFWNCDAPFPLTQLHGTIYLENTNQPLANACVRITMLSTGAASFGYTDASGQFGGCIPKDEALKLEVITPENCGGQVHYTANIGPFSGESTLSNIIVPASAQVPVLNLFGQLLNCNNQPVETGYVKLELGDNKHYLYPDASGQFGFAMITCNNDPKTGQLTGYDLTELLESTPVSISTPPNTINVGNISVCNTLTEFIEYTIDGQSFTKVDPNGGLDGTIGSIWSNDSLHFNQNISFNFVSNGQIGNFPLNSLSVNQLNFDNQAANTLSTTVTAFGNLGDLMIGTFGGNFQDFNGGSHTISGSYRVIREW